MSWDPGNRRRERTSRTVTLCAVLALLAALAVPAQARTHASTHQVSSSNWAGYVVSKSGVRFRRVAGSWVQPAASCAPGPRRYSAYWVGIGGYHSTSSALEQLGTQVDCSSAGQPVYSAWYELLPAPPVTIALPVRAGDTISASTTVSGHTVKFRLVNRTTGATFTKRLHAKHIDVTSAEWIVEAPASCDASGCQTLPLANFGSASFAGARATSTGGHRGPIVDPAWASTAMTLSPDSNIGIGAGLAGPGSSAQATPGALSGNGDAFTVTYQDVPTPGPGLPPIG